MCTRAITLSAKSGEGEKDGKFFIAAAIGANSSSE
jgi:hypothetical protein